MAKTSKGKFEVDVSDLDLSTKELASLELAINKAVLSRLGASSKLRANDARVWGPPGHTQGIRIIRGDLDKLF